MSSPGRIIRRVEERTERRPDEEFFAGVEPGDVDAKEQFQLFEGIGETRAERLADNFDSIADFSRTSRSDQAVAGVSEETAGVLGREAAVRGIRRSDLREAIGPDTESTDILRQKQGGQFMSRPPQPAPRSPGWRNQRGQYVGYEIADPGLRRRTDNGRIHAATGDTKLPLSVQRRMFGDPDEGGGGTPTQPANPTPTPKGDRFRLPAERDLSLSPEEVGGAGAVGTALGDDAPTPRREEAPKAPIQDEFEQSQAPDLLAAPAGDSAEPPRTEQAERSEDIMTVFETADLEMGLGEFRRRTRRKERELGPGADAFAAATATVEEFGGFSEPEPRREPLYDRVREEFGDALENDPLRAGGAD
jgi:hypothetical protein